MSMQQSAVLATPETLPEDITSPRAKLVYLYIDVVGATTVDDLQNCLAMRKIELLSVLNSLTTEGHVECDDGEYATTV